MKTAPMKSFSVLLLFLSIAISVSTLEARAAVGSNHPISVTEANIFVTRTRAIVRIQLFAEDLMLFHDLEPNENDIISAEDLRRGLQLHTNFLLEKVTLRNSAGELIQGSQTDLQPFEVPETGIPTSDLMLHSATYQFEFPFAEPPEFLTLQQDISDANFVFPSEMKLAIHQSGSELTYTDSLKAGSTVTLRFDWENLPLADNATEEEWNKWFEKQREATLGITSYSSVYSFIYIEPAEIRHEVLIPLASLKTILPMQHKDPAFIEVAEQEAVRTLIRDWLKDANPTTINGSKVAPIFSSIDFYGIDLKDFAARADARRVSMANGRVGIIMTYRASDDSVRDATVSWDKFHSSIRKIQSVVFAYPDKLDRHEFSRFSTPEENVYRWSCPAEFLPRPAKPVEAEIAPKPTLSIPVLTFILIPAAVGVWYGGRSRASGRIGVILMLAGLGCIPFARWTIPHPWKSPPEIAENSARDIFEELHNGTYRALDFGTDERIYDVLENTVDGPLLETLFLQLREGLAMRDQGGAVARVRTIEHLATEPIPRGTGVIDWPGFRIRSEWTVAGTVEHWGHVHERRNQFAALFSVEPRNGKWKITSMEIEDQKQLSAKTSLRKF
ncbi:MAG: hypothetical protein JNL58_19125 [Planctomyces sp.]|nr:hypothetical protein [Planctomyces sp.]